MDDPGSRSSRPDRQMASPRQASSTGSGRSRSTGGPDGTAQPEVSMARRLGVVLVVATLVGAVGLAAWNASGRGGGGTDPTPTPVPDATAAVVAGPTGVPNVVPVITPPDEP